MTAQHTYHESDLARRSPLDDDIVAWHFIDDKRTIGLETGLFATKWFDYRHMTPLQATRYYIEAFGSVYRAKYAQNIDFKASQHVAVPTIDSVFEGLQAPKSKAYTKARILFTAFWHGRQVADMLGMPYELYIDLAITYRLRYWKQSTLPRPQHLYSDMVIEKVTERWTELKGADILTSDHPAYLMANYAGLRHQDDYHEWLMSQAMHHGNVVEILTRFVNDDMVPLSKIEARMDPAITERVRSYLN